MSEDFGEPWAIVEDRLVADDRDNNRIVDTYASDHSADRDHINVCRIIDCVNFLRGVPSSTLTGERTNAVLLALAVLHGDESAAYALADLIKEEGGGGPVPISVGDVVVVDPTSDSWRGRLYIVIAIENELSVIGWLPHPYKVTEFWRISPETVRRVGRCPWPVEPK